MTSKANQLVYVIFIIVNYMLKSNANNPLIRTLTNGSSAFSATFDTHKEKNVKISLFPFVHFQSKFGVCVCVCVLRFSNYFPNLKTFRIFTFEVGQGFRE